MAAAIYSNQDSDYFKSAPMRRSHSHSNLGSASLAGYHCGPDLSNPYAHPPTKSFSDSDHSSAPSSPRTAHIESADASYTSTPSSNLSIASDYEEALSIDESPRTTSACHHLPPISSICIRRFDPTTTWSLRRALALVTPTQSRPPNRTVPSAPHDLIALSSATMPRMIRQL